MKKQLHYYINNPNIETSALITDINELLTGRSELTTLDELLSVISQQQQNFKKIILIVDEAQAISYDNLNLLNSLCHSDVSQLFKIILFGQHELDKLINQGSCKQLKQQISANYYLAPLALSSSQYYINQRLTQ